MNRRKKQFSPVLFFLVPLFSPHCAYAVDTLQYTLSPDVTYFQYSEYDDNRQWIDSETGPLFGARFSLLKNYENLRITGHGALSSGVTNYRGKTSGGTTEESKTGEWIFDVRLAIEKIYVSDSVWTFAYGLGMGDRWWRRDIYSTESASGLLEYYNWPYAEVHFGTGTTVFNVPMSVNVSYQRIILPRIFVEFKDNTPPVDFSTGDTNGIELTIDSRLNMLRYISNVSVFLRFWRSAASALHTIPTTSIPVLEPASDSLMYGLSITFLLNE